MSTKSKQKNASAKGLMASLTAGNVEAKHEAQEQAREQTGPEPTSATEAEDVQPEQSAEC